MKFKDNFIWGVATASFQIEGSADKRGDSIWDMGCRDGGYVAEKNNGQLACDHYNRYKEDVALMKELGVTSYRFSISWPRVLPNGIGEVNEQGLAFYVNLVDELLANGIQPCITLYHWDLPTALHYKGGWLNDEISLWFAEYTRVIATAFKGKVKSYITINEPQCIVQYGYKTGEQAPFLSLTNEECLRVTHNILMASGRAFKVIKEVDPEAKVGIAPCSSITLPQVSEEEEAAYNAHFASLGNHFFQNPIFCDPIFFKEYPKDFLRDIGVDFKPTKQDMDIIGCNLDFLAINIYMGEYCTFEGGKRVVVTPPVGSPKNSMDWPVAPEALYYGPKFFYKRYARPIIISENGVPLSEWKMLDGRVDDPMRIDFINRYLEQLHRAHKDGVDIFGYYYWSFMDNFEWAFGYTKRFGIVYVDYQTQERIPKSSYYHYRDIIKNS